jgi:hypothetical protein
MSRPVRAATLLVLGLLLIPVPGAVRAVPLPPVTLTMTVVTTPAYYDVIASYHATISPVPDAGIVYFEASYDDGLTWPDQLGSDGTFSDGNASAGGGYLSTSVPAGDRLVRARYDNVSLGSYANGVSTNALTQAVSKQTASLVNFTAKDSNLGTTIVPGTSPVTLRVERGLAPEVLVHFEEYNGATWDGLGTSSWYSIGSGSPGFATLDVAGFVEGTHTLRARTEATDAITEGIATMSLVVAKAPVTPVVTGPTTVEASSAFPVSAALTGTVNGISPTSTLTLYEGATARGSVVMSSADSIDATIPGHGVGTYTFTAAYAGDGNYTGAASNQLVVNVVANTVHARSVGVQYATFYPVRDGYRDTVGIKGTRDESISVTARIYNGSGSLVKTLTVAKGAGAYSVAWSGRNSAGTILASGTYKVVQSLKDGGGTTKRYTSYVTLSKKRLVTYTKDITKLGSSLTAKGKAGTGTISLSTSAGTVKLKGGSSGYAMAGWELTLPSATVYKALTLKVYAKAALSVPPSQIAAQNFGTCARSSSTTWYDSCFDRWVVIGSGGGTTATWFKKSVSPTANRSGRYARGLVVSDYGLVTVLKVRFSVTYAVLQ